MTKKLHSGDFSGFNILVLFVIKLFKKSTRKVQFTVIKFVLLYVIAIVFQAAALMVFYVSVKLYVDPGAYDLSIIEEFINLDLLTRVELLLVTLTPAFLFLIISSALLKYCRIGLSNLALTLKEQLTTIHLSKDYFFKNDGFETFIKQIDGSFGAVRALFLNSFVFFQAISAAIALTVLEPLLSLFNIILLILFIYLLTTLKKTKVEENNSNENEVIDMLDEEIGINSKSFERIERLRNLGRNYSNIGLFLFVFIGVLFSLEFMNSIEQFSVVLILIRFSMQVYVPIAVISASCVPYKKNMILLNNLMTFKDYWLQNVDKNNNKLYLCISSNFERRNEFISLSNKNGLKDFFTNFKSERVEILIDSFKNRSTINKKELNILIKKKGKIEYGNFLFCV